MAAGNLRQKLNFQSRSVSDDGFGNPATGEYETRFFDAAQVIPRLGSEPVLAQRLQGVQPVTIRVRSSERTRAIGPEWRAVDARTGTVYAIVSPPVNASQKNDYIDMLATSGGQTAS